MHSQDLINAIKTRRDNLDVRQETLADFSGVGL
jgi:predicted transcriptional regulator